jgi:hypothetical protein
MRRAAKRDDNEPAIVKALELSGWTVVRVSDAGAPDLLCARNGRIVLMEVKGPKGKLTTAQVKTHTRLDAAGVVVRVVRSPEEAIGFVNAVFGPPEPVRRYTLPEAIEAGIIPAPRNP